MTANGFSSRRLRSRSNATALALVEKAASRMAPLPGADGRELVLTVLAPGEWFGELSLFDGLPRTHDNVAIGETELWFVPQQAFDALLRERPECWTLEPGAAWHGFDDLDFAEIIWSMT